MNVAIFGGSFNPPHVAHQLVALYVLETCDVDALWLVPTYTHPFHKALADYEHRVAMCELAAKDVPRLSVSRAEEELAKRPDFKASRTLDLVEHLIAQGIAPRLVIGSDILAEKHKWYRWDEVERLAPPIVIARPGYPGGTTLAMPDVSATQVRERLHAGEDASALVPKTVLRYISEHGLYR